jgi:hypothetical protein
MEPEILVTIQFRLPQAEALDRRHLAEHMTPIMKEAVAAGGDKVTISLQPYNPDEESD